MLTEKDYCDYNTCVALIDLGYPEHEILTYDFNLSLYEAQKFLREKKDIHIEITYSPACWTGKIYNLKEQNYIKGFTFFGSFEETFHFLIKEVIKLLKEDN